MPLIVCTIFFIALFTCEAFYFLTIREREQAQLCRHQQTEHPRRNTSDRYLDRL